MIKRFSVMVCFFLLNSIFYALHSGDIKASYVIVDYAKFIYVATPEEMEILVDLHNKEKNHLIAAFFLIKACKGLNPILQKALKNGHTIGIITADELFTEAIAERVFRINSIEFNDLDNLGSRHVVAQQGILASDLVAKINANYDRVVLVTAYSDDQTSIADVLKQQLHNFEVEVHTSPVYLPQSTLSEAIITQREQKEANLAESKYLNEL